MKIKIEPVEVWAEYEKHCNYNSAINLYDNVKKNENFFIGKQWEGVNAPPGLEKPVFNILKRVVSYFVSIIVSDDVSASLSVSNRVADEQVDSFLKVVSEQIDDIFEQCKIKSKNRDAIRNSAVDGDACFYLRYDETVETGQDVKGAIDVEIIDNTDILFANEQVQELQKQPYIIVVMRGRLEDVKAEAEKNGVSESDIDCIVADECNYFDEHKTSDKVTVLAKFFKDEQGRICFTKTTNNVVIKKPTCLNYKLYPFAYFSWDKIKRSYHGQACITGLIPNQIFINKLFAMSMEHVRNMAFPKILHNKLLVPVWDNRVGSAIGVNGDPNLAVAKGFQAPDMSAQVLLMIEKVIQYTRDTMGASDAALGNVRPDNTSAIIAVQKSSAMPLELQRMDFYQFIEDYVHVMLDIMRVNYGIRQYVSIDQLGVEQTKLYNFSQLESLHYTLNVDIGASTYFSELMQVQTVDNLFAKGIITDAITYLESIPDGYIKNKQTLIEKIEEQERLAQQQQMQMMGATPPVIGGEFSDMSTLSQ